MISSGSILLDIALRTFVVYVAVLLGMRLSGKREVGQMTPFDLVLLLLIANAVQNAMTGPDTSLAGGLVAAATLLILNAAISRLAFRNKGIRKAVEGEPLLLINSGKLLKKHLRHEGITEDELRQALREHGVADVTDVHTAILEVDGSISVIRQDETPDPMKPHHHIMFK